MEDSSINIAELFINLGVKGTDKTVGALTSVKKGLSETASMSLEAKAGIVAAMYALERLFAASGQMGTGLTNFNATLGVSAKTLQQYQYAARQMGVSNQEVEGSFKALQSTMTKTLLGEGAPKGLARLAQLTGSISTKDLDQFAKNPELLIQRLQQYAQKEKNVGMRNEVLKSFGVGDNMIAALSRGAFNKQALAKAPTYSTGEIGQLDKANIAWSNLGNKIEMAIGHFNAKHGVELVNGISKMVTQVLKLAEAFTVLAEKLKVFQLLGKAFEGIGLIVQGASKGVDALTGAASDPKKRKQLGQDLGGFLKEAPGVLKEMGKDLLGVGGDYSPKAPTRISPSLPAARSPATGSTQNIQVNQNLNFQHDGKDHQKTGHSVKKAIEDSYRQLSAQGHGA